MEMLSEIEKLPITERITLVEAIWDSIAADSAAVPIPEWQREIVRDRLAEYHRDPESGSGWEEVRARLKSPRKR
jgi:putative addiction module component (TIGR02574 family)